MQRLGRGGPPAGAGPCATPHRFALECEAAAREGKAAAREGKAAALEGDAAVRLSALDVLPPAATAAQHASGIHSSLSTPRPPPQARLMMSTGWAGPRIRRDRNEQRGKCSAPRRALETREGARGLGPILCACVRLGLGGEAGKGGGGAMSIKRVKRGHKR